MRQVLVLAVCSVLLAACGIVGGSSKTTTTTTTASTIPPNTTSTVPQAAIEVRPPSGPVGTTFKLLATRFQPGEGVTFFEIDFPNGKPPFKGTRVHKAGADGSVTDATYLATSNNPAGTYTVKASGDKGTQATGQFEVTAGGATATTSLGRTTTTGRTATTRATTTTTKKP